MCVKEDKIMSATGDLSMQEGLCNYILTLIMIKADTNQFYLNSPEHKLKLRAMRHLFSLTWK